MYGLGQHPGSISRRSDFDSQSSDIQTLTKKGRTYFGPLSLLPTVPMRGPILFAIVQVHQPLLLDEGRPLHHQMVVSDCQHKGQLLPHPTDRCRYLVCDYGHRSYRDRRGVQLFFAVER